MRTSDLSKEMVKITTGRRLKVLYFRHYLVALAVSRWSSKLIYMGLNIKTGRKLVRG
jgi:hypothetical protein